MSKNMRVYQSSKRSRKSRSCLMTPAATRKKLLKKPDRFFTGRNSTTSRKRPQVRFNKTSDGWSNKFSSRDMDLITRTKHWEPEYLDGQKHIADMKNIYKSEMQRSRQKMK